MTELTPLYCIVCMKYEEIKGFESVVQYLIIGKDKSKVRIKEDEIQT